MTVYSLRTQHMDNFNSIDFNNFVVIRTLRTLKFQRNMIFPGDNREYNMTYGYNVTYLPMQYCNVYMYETLAILHFPDDDREYNMTYIWL